MMSMDATYPSCPDIVRHVVPLFIKRLIVTALDGFSNNSLESQSMSASLVFPRESFEPGLSNIFELWNLYFGFPNLTRNIQTGI